MIVKEGIYGFVIFEGVIRIKFNFLLFLDVWA